MLTHSKKETAKKKTLSASGGTLPVGRRRSTFYLPKRKLKAIPTNNLFVKPMPPFQLKSKILRLIFSSHEQRVNENM
jgi:hypothetical protein